jgi:hypothetical protein
MTRDPWSQGEIDKANALCAKLKALIGVSVYISEINAGKLTICTGSDLQPWREYPHARAARCALQSLVRHAGFLDQLRYAAPYREV